ncbi:laminin subunit gamma-1-like isoform X1 [Anoplophora glabripennis]|uniref:laminin subunit gamma-1-like isoform X1 n=1 Tax=Anoplophora glabripennis TaxID=217634 RepID=UPI0008740FE9|nr:laminin subunit gamma-1-like isoform X1 [Anoplophora glabripennis]XP_018564355.1 laminin subunit gamma-1-like isoform X1 [Anoplophora glabripennis]
MAHWFSLLIILVIFKASASTVWNGITPWYTGSKCNCNGYSNRCFFDRTLYEQTGHGGHCMDCTANRDGPNCERCQQNYYMREDGYCIPCDCNEIASMSLQCNAEGKCQCKPGVTGGKCDRCNVNHYDFSTNGCKSCGCLEMGSVNNEPNCNPYSGACHCKENVEGIRCRECKPGYFNLDFDNKFGCTPCFCYGHSSLCKSAPGYSKYLLESSFSRNSERWRAEDEYGRSVNLKYDTFTQSVGVQSAGDVIYFVAPDRFLGDQRASYNQLLEFILKVGDNEPFSTATDIILEGGGSTITNSIFAQQNRMPSVQNQKYSFRLHEHPDYGWQPRLSSRLFIAILANLTAIKIKGTYSPNSTGQLDDVKLETAARGVAGEPALWIEYCDCPTGYIGQYCESCAPGFRHSPALGGNFMPCIPCDCNNHASICDSETGRCICQHNTAGENCELCARGYYGNALAGTPEDCLPCGCPNGGACIQIDEDIVMCTECPTGYTGHRCDSCSDGYFGDPTGQFGPPRACELCECNMNIDPNAIGNCDLVTGDCLRCIHNTGGPKCDVCLSGFYGNALVLPKGDCKQCHCYPPGTEEDILGAPVCDQTTGICLCKAHVTGRNCERCEIGYYNLHSGDGCQICNCDPIGSFNQTCDIYSGQCYCKPGVTGIRCDHCEARKYGFSTEGCKECECDSIGSKDLQCDPTGQCPCLENVEGLKCNRCKENKHDRKKGCVDCPQCYNLVQNEVRSHNDKLSRLYDILDKIEHQPTVITDEKFPEKLKEVEQDINDLHKNVKNITGENNLVQQVQNIRDREQEMSRTLSEVDENIFLISDQNHVVDKNVFNAEQVLEEAADKLNDINNLFEYQGKKALQDALERSKIVGQQSVKMTDIAHEARNLADSLDAQADEIIFKAKEAKNNSIDAYNKVKNANSQLTQVREAIRHIKQDVMNTELKLNESKEWTKDVSDKAAIVKNNALTLLDEVNNLIIPEINVSKLKQKSKDLKEEAHRLKNKSSELFHNSNEIRKSIEEQNYKGRELLQKAHEQNEEVINLRNDLVFADSQANGAINLWNEILERAESNYKLMSEFDTQTQKSKEEAEEALQTIAEIEMIINSTLSNTNEAQENLDDAKLNADLALEKALNANVVAKNASMTAERIKQDAEVLYKNTTALSEEAELMFDRVRNTEGEFKNLFEKTKSNNTLVNQAKEKVGRAGRDTDEASKKILNLMGDIDKILAELQNSPNLNDEDIDRLEEQIRITEERIRDAKLEEKLQDLEKEHKLQNELIDQYKSQIVLLQLEVENIEQIVNTLPSGCYRREDLEP